MNALRRLTLGATLSASFVALATLVSAAPSPRSEAKRVVSDAPARDDQPKVIEIHAKRFEFEPKEVHLAKGESVTLAVTSDDVTHGFFSRPLHFDEDLAPGKTVSIPLAPAQPGTYTVICDHYCGSGHGGMKMVIVVE
jgi:cytochrome c oxidase subunit II